MPAESKLRGNSRAIIPMIPLSGMTPDMIADVLRTVPRYGPTDFRALIENTIGAIHQVPKIFHRETGIPYQPKQIEAYFGRSSGGSNHVAWNLYQCWLRGVRERSHMYGMVFAQTPIKASLRYEKHGILLIEALKEVDGLCISNRTLTAKGGVGSNEPGFLYLTFRLLREESEPAQELTYEQILDCVRREKDRLEGLAENTESSVRDLQVAFKTGLERANTLSYQGDCKVKRIDYNTIV
jgi:hypothetical protein